ncbi:hypothetical protein [Xanthomonas hortorum]|uniref:hypothetical protein n=1 Tax=Xanthomonas hortorum TaxID=56454 RepID=UPI0032E8884F
MSKNPIVAVIVDDDQVKDIIIEGWPENVAIPRFTIANVDTSHVPKDDLFQLRVGDSVFEASGYELDPKLYQPGLNVVSPAAVIEALHDLCIEAVVAQARIIARKYAIELNDLSAARIAVKTSAIQLCITLDEPDLTAAVNQLTQQSS